MTNIAKYDLVVRIQTPYGEYVWEEALTDDELDDAERYAEDIFNDLCKFTCELKKRERDEW